MLKQIGQVSWLGRRFVIVLVSRVRKLLPTNTITSGDHAFSYLPRLPTGLRFKSSRFKCSRLGTLELLNVELLNRVDRQWLVRAAFVAPTVAGQQGISLPPPNPAHFGF